jgi:hypothetical protein
MMMMTKTLIGAFSVVLICWSQQAGAFECLRPEKTSPGVLQETKQHEQKLSQLFAGSDIEDGIGIAVADLRKRYPQATDTKLVNYLVGAYCPVVAQMPGLSDGQKTAAIERFAAKVYELLVEQKL